MKTLVTALLFCFGVTSFAQIPSGVDPQPPVKKHVKKKKTEKKTPHPKLKGIRQ